MTMEYSYLQAAYDQNPVGFALLEIMLRDGQPVDFVFRYANEAAAKLEGWARDELIGKGFYTLFPNADREWLTAYAQTAMGGKPHRLNDYSPERGRYIQIDCFQYAPGLCGCVLRDLNSEMRGIPAPEEKREEMTAEERKLGAILEAYAIPFGELYGLNTGEDFIYIADVENYELLYISAENPELINEGLRDYRGKKCFKLLQNMDEPCPFCTNHLLRYDQYHIWQFYNGFVNREYFLKDKLVEWEGRKARLEVVMDVTDGVRQSQLLMDSLESRSLAMSCSNILMEDAFDLVKPLLRVVEQACRFFQADSGYIVVFYGYPRILAQWPADKPMRMVSVVKEPSQAALHDWGARLTGKSQIIISDVAASGASEEVLGEWRQFGVNSICATPLFIEGKLMGFLNLSNPKHHLSYVSTLDMVTPIITRAIRNKMLQDEKSYLQFRDPLTGSLNLEGFKRRAVELLAQNTNTKYAIIYLDIKRFKYINDIFGYSVGDDLLRHFAAVLEGSLRANEACCRLMADNFYVLKAYETKEEIKAAFRDRNEELREFGTLPDKRFSLELAAGVYLMETPEDRLDLNTMFDRANVAQKKCKSQAGDSLGFYTTDLWNAEKRKMSITQHLGPALESQTLEVYFQPQYNYSTGELIGAEALVRWDHPSLGWISPGEFIPVLERNGRIFELDEYVWERACYYMRHWQDEMGLEAPVSIAVNISRLDVYNPLLSQTLLKLVEKYRIPAQSLRLEITENAYVDNPVQLIRAVDALQTLGFTVEMDDFGSGYSSLNILKDVPVDVLKLDLKFLAGEGNSSRGGNILSSVVRMARWLKLPVIAEGVETKEQAEYLKGLGCELMQGYYFSQPLPPKAFAALLQVKSMADPANQFDGIDMLNTMEFLDSQGKSSFLFNRCIGGAGLFEWVGDTLEALLLNDRYFDIIGMSRHEYEPYRVQTLNGIVPEDRPEVIAALTRAMEQGSSVSEVRMLDAPFAPGVLRWVRVNSHYLSSNGQSHMFFILVEDVTKHRETEQRLEQTTEELTSFVELLPGGVFRYSLTGKNEFRYYSRGLLRMLGYTPKEFQEKFQGQFPLMIAKQDRERVLAELARQMAGGEFSYCEYRIETAAGDLRWVCDAGRFVTDSENRRWAYGVVLDIEAQKQAEANKLFELYGRGMAMAFNEEYDADFEKDEIALIWAKDSQGPTGVCLHGIRAFLEEWMDMKAVMPRDRAALHGFINMEQAAGAFARGEAASLDVETETGWWREMLLPLTKTRAMLCGMDVTAVKQSEALAAKTVEYDTMRTTVEGLPLGLCVFEFKGGNDMRLLFVNNMACKMLDIQRSEAERYFMGHRDRFFRFQYNEEILGTDRPFEFQFRDKQRSQEVAIHVLSSLSRQRDGRIMCFTALMDVTESLRATRSLQQQTVINHMLCELPGMVVFDYDPQENVMRLVINIPDEGPQEYVLPNYMPKGMGRYIDHAHLPSFLEGLAAATKTAKSGTLECRMDFFGKGYRWQRLHYVSLADEEGTVNRVVGRVDDVEDDVQREAELRRLVQRDAMTGVFNSAATQNAVEDLLKENRGGTLFIVDIDDFKMINDMRGHLFGDAYLREISARLRRMFREKDVLGRIGGDEFAIFLPAVTSLPLVRARAESLISAFNSVEVPDMPPVQCSVGIAVAAVGENENYHALFRQADAALYQAKDMGKGCYSISEKNACEAPRRIALSERESAPAAINALDSLSCDVFRILYHAQTTEEGIESALSAIGKRIDVSRVYIFENTVDDEHMDNTFEWCAPGTPGEIANLKNIPYETSNDDYRRNFDRDGIFYCRDITDIPKRQREILEPQSVKSLLQYAIIKDGVFKGFIGFDECRENRFWTKQQISALTQTAQMLALSLARLRSIFHTNTNSH